MTEQSNLVVFQRRTRYRLERFDDIKFSTQSYLVKDLLPRRGLAFYSGQSKAGKTFVCLDHCLKIASGAKVMGRKAKHMGIVYVAAEDPDGVRMRIDGWRQKYPRGSTTPFILIGQRVDLMDDASVDDLKGAIRDAVAQFDDDGFDLGAIVFDTLAQCIPGADENSSGDMGRALQVVQDFGDTFNTLSVVVAHHGKNAAAGIRGWSGLGAAADAVITVTRDEATKERTLTLDKVKNGKDGDVIAFTLAARVIGQDEDGDDIWTCTVNYEGPADKVPKSPRVVALKPAEEMLLSAVKWVVDNGSTQTPPATALGVREGTRAVRKQDVYARAADMGLTDDGEKYEAYKKRRQRALEALSAAKRVRIEGDLLWLI